MRAYCKVALVGIGAWLIAGCVSGPGARPPWSDRSVDALVAPSLRKFRDAAEFERYRARLWKVGEEHGADWARNEPIPVAALLASSSTVVAPPCDPALQPCPQALEQISVTASRVTRPSITNNQEAGVDEGDIVKRFGRFLIVLHDGRLFSIDTGESGGRMTLVDRLDVYPSPDDDAWYDELLISDDALVVTGYSYEQEASELAIFRIDGAGVLTRAATFYITSDDYYSEDNYASRLVDGNLVLYTPLDLTAVRPGKEVGFPRIRRWTAATGYSDWQPLFGATDIYAPIQRTLDPVAHTISVCPIEVYGDWHCRSTGVIGPWYREFYVSPEYAFMWLSTDSYDLYRGKLDRCPPNVLSRDDAALPSGLYRIPLFGGSADAVLTVGAPLDQFSLDARAGEFLALLRVDPGYCEPVDDEHELRYARIPNTVFTARPRTLARDAYTAVPDPGGDIENRFTEGYLVYAGNRDDVSPRFEREGAEHRATEVVAVPVGAPQSLSIVPLRHTAVRVEVFGDNVVVDGYETSSGLSVSTLDLRRRPTIADTAYVDRALESEGRSHAFNARVEASGDGVFGLPTVFKDSLHRSWDSASNLHFFTVDAHLGIHQAGYLAASEEQEDPDYECEVSCIDWYGNARPIFMDGRIFALTGTEVIEGYLAGGQIVERQRVNMTGIPLHPRAPREDD
jgi:hypothetical protein